MDRLVSVLGLFVMIGIAYAVSTNRRRVRWDIVGVGVGMQLAFALLILKWSVGRGLFDVLGQGFVGLIEIAHQSTAFIFGEAIAGQSPGTATLVVLIPVTIIVVSSLSSLLYHYGVLQLVVRGIARVMRLLAISGAESLAVAANIFMGMTEAPLFVRPYVEDMTESELFCVMNSGMATIAGGVMAAYVAILSTAIPDIGAHLLCASVMSAPASVAIAKLMVPELGEPLTRGRVKITVPRTSRNGIDAAAQGAAQGSKLAINVIAMLVAFIALIALVNAILGAVGGLFGAPQLSLQMLLGYVCAPIAWVMGVPWSEATTVGTLLGEKTILNEFIAYTSLNNILTAETVTLSARSTIIASYALCGFANFGSLAIMIGGIGGIAPRRRGDIARLGLRSILGGSLAAFMTATIAGMLL